MAYITQVGTSTLSNQNISAALLAHTFTNDTRIRKLWIDVFLDQVAGNGDYIAYVTRQKAGAGSFYESIRTTKAAAAGVTSVMFNSIPLIVNSTDVVKVYVIGLAGDTVTPDIITEINEEWVNVDASGRVDVGAWVGVAPNALVGGDVPAEIAEVGVPVALDGGVATLAGMLTKIADNNGGGDFIAASDSLHEIGIDTTDVANRLGTAMIPDGPNYKFSANALEDGVAPIADGVLDEAIAGHAIAGSVGATLAGLVPGAAVVLNAEITEIHTT